MNLINVLVFIIGGLFFIFAAILAYYSLRNARFMIGSRGRQIIALGAVLFLVAAIAEATDILLLPNIGLHLSALSLFVIALSTFMYGSFLTAKAIQKVYSGSLIKIVWKHPGSIYNLIGILLLVTCGMPLYSYHVLRSAPQEFSWLSVFSISIWTLSFANLLLSARTLGLNEVKPETERRDAIPLRDDILAAKAYGDLVNTFLPAMRPVAGLFKETLLSYFECTPVLFEGCRLKKDGTIDTEPIIRNVDRIHRDNRIQDICTMFSVLSSRILEMYGAVTSAKHAEEVLARSYRATREIYGESPVLFDILRSLPEGVLGEERITLLPRKELESRIREHTRELEESRNYINNIVKSMTDMLIVLDPEGRIRNINKATELLLGYGEKELVGRPVDFILAEDAAQHKGVSLFHELVEAGSIRNIERSYMPKQGGKIPVLSSYSVMHDDNNNIQGIVCVAQDITERKLAEEKEKKYIRDLMFLSKTAMGLVELPPEDDIYHFTGEKLKELAGDSIVGITSYDAASNTFHARTMVGVRRQVERVLELLGRDLDSIPFKIKDEVRLKLTSGKLMRLPADLHELTNGEIPKDVGHKIEEFLDLGDIYAMGLTIEGELFGSAVIFTRRGTKLEDKETIETFINQASVSMRRRQAEEQTKASLAEKEVLLKEIHHRVKNNLQVISSLLNLQSGYITDEQSSQMFRESQNRVRSMALIHEKLYQSMDLARIDFAGYVRELADYLFRMYGANSHNIKLEVNVDDVPLDIDTAIPCGLIINELVSNSLKYGFPAETEKRKPESQRAREPEGEIRVGLCAGNDGKLILTVSDNGIGFPEDLDFQDTDSLGLQLVNTLTGQLEGDIQLDRKAGTTFNITFAGPKSKRRG